LKFYECKKISASKPVPKMTLKNKISVAAIRRYDYLFSDGPDLVSSRLAGIINSSALADGVQLIRTDVTINGEGYNDYFIINYLRSESAFDMAQSINKPLARSMPEGPKKFNSIALLNKDPVSNIFRALESSSHVVCSDQAVAFFKANPVNHTRGPLKDTRGIGGTHWHETQIRESQGLGRNEFAPSLKRELDITSGALRKSGVPSSRVKQLKRMAKKFHSGLSTCG
jgi:hypothetical protein